MAPMQRGKKSLSQTEPYLTVYIASWDEPSRRHVLNLHGYKHKVIDIDINRDIAAAQGIKAVPTTQIYIDGELKLTKIGSATPKIINDWIKEIV